MQSHAHLTTHLCKSQSEIRHIVWEFHFTLAKTWSPEGPHWIKPQELGPPLLHLAQCLELIATSGTFMLSHPTEKWPQAKPPSPCYLLLIAGHPGEDGGVCTFDPNAARLGSLLCRLWASVGVCFRLWWHEKYFSEARCGCIGAWLRGSQCTGIWFVCKRSIPFSYQHGCN